MNYRSLLLDWSRVYNRLIRDWVNDDLNLVFNLIWLNFVNYNGCYLNIESLVALIFFFDHFFDDIFDGFFLLNWLLNFLDRIFFNGLFFDLLWLLFF